MQYIGMNIISPPSSLRNKGLKVELRPSPVPTFGIVLEKLVSITSSN